MYAQGKQGAPECIRRFCAILMKNGQGTGRIPLTAGIILGKFIFPFIIEQCQFVIVVFGDRLEIDGLPDIGGVVSYDATGAKPNGFLLTLFKPVAVSGSENNSSWNLATILRRLV